VPNRAESSARFAGSLAKRGRFVAPLHLAVLKKSLCCRWLRRGPALASAMAGHLYQPARGRWFEECVMSLSVGGSNNNNYLALQALWQQQQPQGATGAQSNPLAQLLGALEQQGSGTTSSATSGASAGTTGTSATTSSAANSFPQFGSQTLQALLALQNGGASSSASSLLGDAGGANGTDPTQQSQPGEGRHHHHHMDGDGGGAGATSQSTSTSSSTADASSTSGTTNAANNNLVERLMQMQAQLLNASSTQTIATV